MVIDQSLQLLKQNITGILEWVQISFFKQGQEKIYWFSSEVYFHVE